MNKDTSIGRFKQRKKPRYKRAVIMILLLLLVLYLYTHMEEIIERFMPVVNER